MLATGDYQAPIPPLPGLEKHPSEIAFEMRFVPAPVCSALKYIENCNQYTQVRGFPHSEGVKFKTNVLHPVQEGLMRLACQLVGDYYTGKKFALKESPSEPARSEQSVTISELLGLSPSTTKPAGTTTCEREPDAVGYGGSTGFLFVPYYPEG